MLYNLLGVPVPATPSDDRDCTTFTLRYNPAQLTWQQAENWCASFATLRTSPLPPRVVDATSHLTSLTSDLENIELRAEFLLHGESAAWIGGAAKGCEANDTWTWSDGRAWNYTFWLIYCCFEFFFSNAFDVSGSLYTLMPSKSTAQTFWPKGSCKVYFFLRTEVVVTKSHI